MAKIKKKQVKKSEKKNCSCCNSSGNCGGAVYGLGFIGAAFYYIFAATTFWTGVLGILKALVWPAFLVFELLKFLVG